MVQELALVFLLSPATTQPLDAVPQLAAQSSASAESAWASLPEPVQERVYNAARKIHPRSLLRVTFADMMYFEGYASDADEVGLHGLRPREGFMVAPLPETIPWMRIFRVEKRGNSAARGALSGGLGVGVVGGLAGAALVAAFQGTGSEVAGGAAIGFGVCGVVGAAIGALIGAPIPHWHTIY